MDTAPSQPVHRADVYAARNEFEPFQVVLRARGSAVSNVNLECSDLRSRNGDVIGKANITIYAEQFINVKRPSLASGDTGEWPDAVVPQVDRYLHEKRNAFPLNLSPARDQAVWIEIFVPETAAPGEYLGTVQAMRDKEVQFKVPVHLTVWKFTLPSTASLKSSYGFNGTTALKLHYGRYTSDGDLYELTKLYAMAALLHRISIHGGSQIPPKHQYSGGRIQMDWGAYDSEMGPLLDGTALPGGPLHGAKTTSVEVRNPGSFDSPEEAAQYWAAWSKHFIAKGWGDRLFFYLWDEPTPSDYPKLIEKGRAVLAAVPAMRTLVTIPSTPKLAEVVRIWAPLVNCLVRKPGSDDFCMEAPLLEEYAKERTAFWFYQSCASHGCAAPGGKYFEGWPSYAIDAPGTANRVMQWVAWKYGIEGELYYSMNETYARGDPWIDARLYNGNGDGTLFYPGTPSRIGGHTHIPIESIRLKLIREGYEDYEYLALLSRTGHQTEAAAYVERIAAAPYKFESRPEAFLKVRREMGEMLSRSEIPR